MCGLCAHAHMQCLLHLCDSIHSASCAATTCVAEHSHISPTPSGSISHSRPVRQANNSFRVTCNVRGVWLTCTPSTHACPCAATAQLACFPCSVSHSSGGEYVIMAGSDKQVSQTSLYSHLSICVYAFTSHFSLGCHYVDVSIRSAPTWRAARCSLRITSLPQMQHRRCCALRTVCRSPFGRKSCAALV
jgi:hypothetical protein